MPQLSGDCHSQCVVDEVGANLGELSFERVRHPVVPSEAGSSVPNVGVAVTVVASGWWFDTEFEMSVSPPLLFTDRKINFVGKNRKKTQTFFDNDSLSKIYFNQK